MNQLQNSLELILQYLGFTSKAIFKEIFKTKFLIANYYHFAVIFVRRHCITDLLLSNCQLLQLMRQNLM